MLPVTITCLRELIDAYQREHAWGADEDPASTHYMLSTCRTLAEELERQLLNEPHATGAAADRVIPF